MRRATIALILGICFALMTGANAITLLKRQAEDQAAPVPVQTSHNNVDNNADEKQVFNDIASLLGMGQLTPEGTINAAAAPSTQAAVPLTAASNQNTGIVPPQLPFSTTPNTNGNPYYGMTPMGMVNSSPLSMFGGSPFGMFNQNPFEGVMSAVPATTSSPTSAGYPNGGAYGGNLLGNMFGGNLFNMFGKNYLPAYNPMIYKSMGGMRMMKYHY